MSNVPSSFYFDNEYDEEESNEYNNESSNLLVLNEEIDFGIWELAESYLNNYAKQKGILSTG
ncbi:6114_t:CDS:2 [Dentiscutata erythropus]|uniref:6114_t:CDS:1 n=1 Tax=Dentiscutata erythropus TaxID=1348616 RepID=A0A9N8Z4T7_9GLOM|nr:6114_t:CDS:2 [Dentiscutata erythropus]